MDISIIIKETPDAILKGIAERVKEKRLERNLTQKAFAKRAGIGYDAYRKFENSGEVTLRNLVLCAIALDDAEGFMKLKKCLRPAMKEILLIPCTNMEAHRVVQDQKFL